MVAVPKARPETIPVVLPTATAAVVPLQVPPADVLLSVVVAPMHTWPAPVMGAGEGCTVTVV
jgi:hypothetical protein